MGLECLQRRSRPAVPEPDGAIDRSRRQPLAIRREGYGSDVFPMALECLQHRSRPAVPELDGAALWIIAPMLSSYCMSASTMNQKLRTASSIP
jgi:hypothetical protein